MGILKDLFGKKEIESIQDYEKEIQKLQGSAYFSEVVAIVGTGGRLKGLPLIYSARDEKQFKILTARMSELIANVKNLQNEKELEEVSLVYKGLYIKFIPITENLGFLGISPMKNEIALFQDWLKKNQRILTNLFSS